MRFNYLIVTCLFLIFLSGCKKENYLSSPKQEQATKPQKDLWEKSDAKAHPYNVRNIMEAQKELGIPVLRSSQQKNLYKYVSGISWSAMFNNFSASDNLNLYKTRLIEKFPAQGAQILQLFNEYSL